MRAIAKGRKAGQRAAVARGVARKDSATSALAARERPRDLRAPHPGLAPNLGCRLADTDTVPGAHSSNPYRMVELRPPPTRYRRPRRAAVGAHPAFWSTPRPTTPRPPAWVIQARGKPEPKPRPSTPHRLLLRTRKGGGGSDLRAKKRPHGDMAVGSRVRVVC